MERGVTIEIVKKLITYKLKVEKVSVLIQEEWKMGKYQKIINKR